MVIAAFFGIIGAVGTIFLSGGYFPNRKIVDYRSSKDLLQSIENTFESVPQPSKIKVKYIIVFGSFKEIVIGAIGGILTTITIYAEEKTDFKILITIALLTGFGGSTFLKKYIAEKTKRLIEEAKEEDDRFNAILDKYKCFLHHNSY